MQDLTVQAASVRIGARSFPFTDAAAVSAAYRATIDRLGLGCSETPPCEILDGAGAVVGEVSYNGRVWARDRNGYLDYERCVYDPVGGAEEIAEAVQANRTRFGSDFNLDVHQAPARQA